MSDWDAYDNYWDNYARVLPVENRVDEKERPLCRWCSRLLEGIIYSHRNGKRKDCVWCSKCDGPGKMTESDVKNLLKFRKEFEELE
jgi:hypothetical protein